MEIGYVSHGLRQALGHLLNIALALCHGLGHGNGICHGLRHGHCIGLGHAPGFTCLGISIYRFRYRYGHV